MILCNGGKAVGAVTDIPFEVKPGWDYTANDLAVGVALSNIMDILDIVMGRGLREFSQEVN